MSYIGEVLGSIPGQKDNDGQLSQFGRLEADPKLDPAAGSFHSHPADRGEKHCRQ